MSLTSLDILTHGLEYERLERTKPLLDLLLHGGGRATDEEVHEDYHSPGEGREAAGWQAEDCF
jgi:hypothetical protein